MSDTRQNGRFDRENPHHRAHHAHPPHGGGHPRVELPAVDRRAARTRRALHEALMSLIVERGYDAVSVRDIAERADVGRSTFYAHFIGKDDLLRNSGDWIRGMLIGHRGHGEAHDDAPRPLFDFSLVMFQHAREYRAMHRAVDSGSAGPIIQEVKREILTELFREDLARVRPSSIANREACVQYLVGAYMSLLTWWLGRGAKESPEHMDAMFRSLVFEGLRVDPSAPIHRKQE